VLVTLGSLPLCIQLRIGTPFRQDITDKAMSDREAVGHCLIVADEDLTRSGTALGRIGEVAQEFLR
jgi:hypothetical protein